jgi:hypothetical protein
MNSVQQIKLTQFNTNQKATTKSIARSIAAMNNDISAAIEHQAYARKNPDLNVDSGLVDLMGLSVDELISQFAEITAKIGDLVSVKTGTMTVDSLIAKYGTDLTKYSSELA